MIFTLKSRLSWALGLLFVWVALASAQDTRLRHAFSSDEINTDIERLQEILQAMHPGLHLYISPKDLQDAFEAARIQNGESRTLRQAFLNLAGVLDKVRCGHTFASVPNAAQQELTDGAVFFPLPLKFLNGRAFVNHKSVELPCGVEVLSINGLALEKLVPQLMPFVTGDGFVDTYRYELLNDSFAMSLAIAFPQRGQFLVEYRTPQGDVTMKTVQGIGGEELENRMKTVAFGPPHLLPYRFRLVQPDTVLMAIDTFDNDFGSPPFRIYRQFLSKAFKALEKSPEVKNLILDLRLNEGGYMRNEMLLYSFLTEKPFREMQEGDATRNTIAFKENLSRLYQTRGMIKGYERRLGRELEPANSGFELSEDWIPQLLPDERRFEGDLYVLISGRTFSAGAAICSRLREADRAVFIGEETGGVHGTFTAGTTLVYSLPNTEIEVAVPILKYSTLKEGSPETGRGVKPDHQVRARPEDINSGEDRVLQFALELIKRLPQDQ